MIFLYKLKIIFLKKFIIFSNFEFYFISISGLVPLNGAPLYSIEL